MVSSTSGVDIPSLFVLSFVRISSPDNGGDGDVFVTVDEGTASDPPPSAVI